MRRVALLFALSALVAACTSDAGTDTTVVPREHRAARPGRTAEPVAPPTPGALGRRRVADPARAAPADLARDRSRRSGQIVFVPQEPNFVGTNFPHSGPWNYLQDVPLFLYGPGIIPAVGRVDVR